MTGASGSHWTQEEIDSLIDRYFFMLQAEVDRRPYTKASVNRDLQKEIDRTRGSIEFKFANMSAVLDDLGLPYVDGYKPRRNYQESLQKRIKERLPELSFLSAQIKRGAR